MLFARRTAAAVCTSLVAAVLAALALAPNALAAVDSTTGVSCPAGEHLVLQDVVCTVIVSGVAPTGDVTLATDSTGTFPDGTACTLDGAGRCEGVKYRPGVAGAHKITATYAGDVNNNTSNGFTTIIAKKRTVIMTIGCPTFVDLSGTATCSPVVESGSLGTPPAPPTGTVSFASNLAGTFTSNPCTLAATTCSVAFAPAALGTHALTVTYSGDALYTAQTAIGGIAVISRTASAGFTMTCAPTTLSVGVPTTCTAVLADGGGPSSAVSFKSNNAGTFSDNAACIALTGTCSVTYTPTAAGAHAVTATAMKFPGPMLSALSDLDVKDAAAPAPGGSGPGPAEPAAAAVSLSVPASLKAVRGKLRVTCVAAGAPIRRCAVVLRKKGSKTVLGKGTATRKGTARRLPVTVTLTRAGKGLLAAARKPLKLVASATITPAGAKPTTVRKPLTVKP